MTALKGIGCPSRRGRRREVSRANVTQYACRKRIVVLAKLAGQSTPPVLHHSAAPQRGVREVGLQASWSFFCLKHLKCFTIRSWDRGESIPRRILGLVGISRTFSGSVRRLGIGLELRGKSIRTFRIQYVNFVFGRRSVLRSEMLSMWQKAASAATMRYGAAAFRG